MEESRIENKPQEVVSGRLYHLDLMKALAIISMVMCHPICMLGLHRPMYKTEFLYIIGDYILGDYLVVAHGFMFAMGVGMVFSRKSDPSRLIRRGIRLYLSGYLLNFLRYDGYFLGIFLITGKYAQEVIDFLLIQDILQFAGLAFLFTGILKGAGLKEKHLLLIGAVLAVLNYFFPHVDTGNYALNLILGSFFYLDDYSTFCLCGWYLFVAVGLFFGRILKKVTDQDRFYRRLLVISGGITVIYIALTWRFGLCFLTRGHEYYNASPMEAVGLLSIDFFFLSAFYFLLKKVDVSQFGIFLEMSRNLTTIYFIHWIILGFVDMLFCYMLGFVFSYPVIYAFGAGLLVISTLLARWITAHRSRKMHRKSGKT